MSDPWFDPNMYSWIPGTVYGVAGGLLGGLSGTLAPRGKARNLVLGAWCLFGAIGAVLLVASVIALFAGQPYGIWYGLGLPGLMGTMVFPFLLIVIRRQYRAAEERRMQAVELTN